MFEDFSGGLSLQRLQAVEEGLWIKAVDVIFIVTAAPISTSGGDDDVYPWDDFPESDNEPFAFLKVNHLCVNDDSVKVRKSSETLKCLAWIICGDHIEFGGLDYELPCGNSAWIFTVYDKEAWPVHSHVRCEAGPGRMCQPRVGNGSPKYLSLNTMS